MKNLFTSGYNYDIRESIHNFNFQFVGEGWTDEMLNLKVLYW